MIPTRGAKRHLEWAIIDRHMESLAGQRKADHMRPKMPPVRAWDVLVDAAHASAARSVASLWKHMDPPKGWTESCDAHLRDTIERCVIHDISERFDFDREEP